MFNEVIIIFFSHYPTGAYKPKPINNYIMLVFYNACLDLKNNTVINNVQGLIHCMPFTITQCCIVSVGHSINRWEHLVYQFGCHDELIQYVIKAGNIVYHKS